MTIFKLVKIKYSILYKFKTFLLQLSFVHMFIWTINQSLNYQLRKIQIKLIILEESEFKI